MARRPPWADPIADGPTEQSADAMAVAATLLDEATAPELLDQPVRR
jgi:tryptophan synthase alpha subunit